MKLIVIVFLFINHFEAFAKETPIEILCSQNTIKINSIAKCKNIELDNPTRLAVDFPFEKSIKINNTSEVLKSCISSGVSNIRQNKTRVVIDINGKIKNLKYNKEKCETIFEIEKNITKTEGKKEIKKPTKKIEEKKREPKNNIEINKEKEKKSQENIQDLSAALKIKIKSDIVIAIDAGHGGRDPGTMHHGMQEKTITLKLAKILNQRLKSEGYKTIMTRDHDVFIPLKKRIQIARRANANFMISIHIDYEPTGTMEGSTIYTISDTFWKQDNLFKKYKTEDLTPEEFLTEYPDQVSDLLVIMMKSKSDELSFNLSKQITEEFKSKKICIKCRQKLARFVVLHGVDIPCILIETAYISNKKDLNKIKSKELYEDFSNSITKAVNKMFVERKL